MIEMTKPREMVYSAVGYVQREHRVNNFGDISIPPSFHGGEKIASQNDGGIEIYRKYSLFVHVESTLQCEKNIFRDYVILITQIFRL